MYVNYKKQLPDSTSATPALHFLYPSFPFSFASLPFFFSFPVLSSHLISSRPVAFLPFWSSPAPLFLHHFSSAALARPWSLTSPHTASGCFSWYLLVMVVQ